MPHKTIVMPFSNHSNAYQYFCTLLNEASQLYGLTDMNGASLDHCKMFGRYEIKHGFFIQLYEADLDYPEKINWPDITRWA